MMWHKFVEWFITGSVTYYFLVNSTFMALLLAALVSLSRQSRLKPLLRRVRESFPSFSPPISILAPAYNEEATIVESLKSFLLLNYPSFEVIVINDGSKDGTMAQLKLAFQLEPVDIACDRALSSTPIRATYQSRIHPNLIVVDKENGGKADALNVGLGFCQHSIFCAVDSDSMLETDALIRVALPFLEEPGRTIATGGTIRIANGTEVRFGRVARIKLPRNFLVLMQIVEYTRAFLCGRIGWNVLNSTLVISGAFGLFSKRAVQRIGGYTSGCIGEDMELIVRLHRYYREHNLDYSIVFVPDPVCWTEAPATFSALGRQRNRWQRGLIDVIARNRNMIFNSRYGLLGMVAMPYYFFVELLGPFIEIISLTILLIAWMMGQLNVELVRTFLVASVLYGVILSISAILIEEIYFSKYKSVRQFLILFAVTLLESVFYRPISSYWRVRGLLDYYRGDHSWGHLKREGFTQLDKAG